MCAFLYDYNTNSESHFILMTVSTARGVCVSNVGDVPDFGDGEIKQKGKRTEITERGLREENRCSPVCVDQCIYF